MPFLKRLRSRRAWLAVLAASFALLGAWVGQRIAGPATYTTTVADVELEVAVSRPAERGLNLYVPLADWGLRAPIVDAPLRVDAEPRRVDRVGVVRIIADGRSPRTAVADLRADLDSALRSAVVRFGVVSIAGGLAGGLVALLVWHAAGVRGRRLLLAPALATGVVSGGVLILAAWSAASFDASRLERPAYYASGTELERILAQADALRRSGRKYADGVDGAVRAITGLLDPDGEGAITVVPPSSREDDLQRVVLASDIHNNLLTLPALRRYARGHLTVLAGDFTINGGRMETPLLRRMAAVGDPVVAVSGNHDSLGTMRELEDRGAIVLDHEDGVRTISGVRVAGFEDPLMLGGREFPRGIRAGMSFGLIEGGHERFIDAVRERWAWWRALEKRPSLLIVHQEAIGRALANLIWREAPDGPPLTILVGHTHVQRMDRYGPVTVVNAGSVGAGGVFGLGTQRVGFAMLDVRTDGGLEATDLVSQDPATSAARARRVIVDSPDCDETLVFCHDEPDPPEEFATPEASSPP